MVPALVTHWDVSDDGHSTVVAFHFRDSLKFHNGRPVNANDFVGDMMRIVKLQMAKAEIFNEYRILEQNVDDAFYP
ncbi:ABC-type transport system substrate-binding protein [Bartonella fuyuanensis]|uniref:ABC-type transport system substrate-binding protein n=1 Tax=Bartonella fuyuanensis TaxID=1460968 RepID=A0A840DZH3_9HYPH|nr:ABC-type transport system substrate-binding protein [Bartonella fuyuanensis]